MAAFNCIVQLKTTQRGVTLLENMVALLVISVGMLGFAGMQAFTLRGSASSTHRQLAMQQAQDMADRIRSNPGAYFDVTDPVNHYHNVTPKAPATLDDCRADRCDAIALAAYDITEWQLANQALPGATGIAGGYIISQDLTDAASTTPIMLSPGTNMPVRQRFTIAIRWDGNGTGTTSVGAEPTNCARATADDLKCYALVIDL